MKILSSLSYILDTNAGVVEIYERTSPNAFTLFQTLEPPGDLGSAPRKLLSLLLHCSYLYKNLHSLLLLQSSGNRLQLIKT